MYFQNMRQWKRVTRRHSRVDFVYMFSVASSLAAPAERVLGAARLSSTLTPCIVLVRYFNGGFIFRIEAHKRTRQGPQSVLTSRLYKDIPGHTSYQCAPDAEHGCVQIT